MQLLLTATIVDDVRFRVDWASTTSLTDAVLYRLAQQSIANLSQLVQSALSQELFWFTGIDVTYLQDYVWATLPDNLERIVSVTWKKDDTTKILLSPMDKDTRSQRLTDDWNNTLPKYFFESQKLYMFPAPAAQEIVTVDYTATQWISTTPSDLNGFYGEPLWLEWVVLDMCKKIRQREQKDASDFIQDQAAIEQRIRDSAPREYAGVYSITENGCTQYPVNGMIWRPY